PDVEQAHAGVDEAAGHHARLVPGRHRAVVARVAHRVQPQVLVLVGCPGGGRVDLELDVGDHLGPGLVGDVDDARRAHGLGRGHRRVARELVDLDEIRVPADLHRQVRLGDADVGPAQVADHRSLGIGLALLDLADVEDGQAGAGRTEVGDVGDVQAVAVVAHVEA